MDEAEMKSTALLVTFSPEVGCKSGTVSNDVGVRGTDIADVAGVVPSKGGAVSVGYVMLDDSE